MPEIEVYLNDIGQNYSNRLLKRRLKIHPKLFAKRIDPRIEGTVWRGGSPVRFSIRHQASEIESILPRIHAVDAAIVDESTDAIVSIATVFE